MKILAAIFACTLLCSCASNAYKDQATALGSSASTLAGAIPSQAAVDAEEESGPDLQEDMLLSSGPLTYTKNCGDHAFASYVTFVQALSNPQSDQDSAYLALKQTAPCKVQFFPAPAVPAAPRAPVGTKPDPNAQEKDKLLRQDPARAAAQAQLGYAKAQMAPAATCKGQCSADDYLSKSEPTGVGANRNK